MRITGIDNVVVSRLYDGSTSYGAALASSGGVSRSAISASLAKLCDAGILIKRIEELQCYPPTRASRALVSLSPDFERRLAVMVAST